MIELICISPIRTPINFNSDFLNISGDYIAKYTGRIAAALPEVEVRGVYSSHTSAMRYETLAEDATNGRLKIILELALKIPKFIPPGTDDSFEVSDISIRIYDNTISIITYRLICDSQIIETEKYQLISNSISKYIYNYIWSNIIWKIYDIYIKINDEKDIIRQIDDYQNSFFREKDSYILFQDMNSASRDAPFEHGVLWTTRCILQASDNIDVSEPAALEGFSSYGDLCLQISEGVIRIASTEDAARKKIVDTIIIFQYFSALFEVVYQNSRRYFSVSMHKMNKKTKMRRIGDASFFSISVNQFVNNYRAALYGLQGTRRSLGAELAKCYQMDMLIDNMTSQVDNMRARFAALRARQQSRFTLAIELALLVIGALGLTEVAINLYWFRFSDEFERANEYFPLLTWFGAVPVDVSLGTIFLIITLLAYALVRSRL